MSQSVEIKGLNELLASMQAYPQQLYATMGTTMATALNIIWSKVPAYPRQNPESKYRRTGTLGRSLGISGEGGGMSGEPSIYRINALGAGANWEGKFGSNLEYAQYVIGDTTQSQRALMAGWWQMLDVMLRAQGDIVKLFNNVAEEMAAFLGRQGK